MKLTSNTNRLLSEHPHPKQALLKSSVHYWAQTDHIRQVAFFNMEEPHFHGFSLSQKKKALLWFLADWILCGLSRGLLM